MSEALTKEYENLKEKYDMLHLELEGIKEQQAEDTISIEAFNKKLDRISLMLEGDPSMGFDGVLYRLDFVHKLIVEVNNDRKNIANIIKLLSGAVGIFGAQAIYQMVQGLFS